MKDKEIYVLCVIWFGLVIVIFINAYMIEPRAELLKEGAKILREANSVGETDFELGVIHQITELPKYKYEQNLSVSIHCDIYQGNISFYYGDEYHIDTNCEEVFEGR